MSLSSEDAQQFIIPVGDAPSILATKYIIFYVLLATFLVLVYLVYLRPKKNKYSYFSNKFTKGGRNFSI